MMSPMNAVDGARRERRVALLRGLELDDLDLRDALDREVAHLLGDPERQRVLGGAACRS